MPERGWHRDDDVDFLDLEPRPRHALHPIDEIVSNPQMRLELERVYRLTRIAIGELTIHGIAPGKWRLLTDEETAYLKSL